MWKRYKLEVPVTGDPDHPEVYSLETYETPELTPVLSYHQRGFEMDGRFETFVELETVVKLGELATAILAGTAIPDEEGD